jgi:hypothetical protein
MSEIKNIKRLQEEKVDAKCVKVYGKCPKCERGYLLPTGRANMTDPPQMEYVCSSNLCRNKIASTAQYPRVEFVNADGSEDVLEKIRQQSESKSVILPQ